MNADFKGIKFDIKKSKVIEALLKIFLAFLFAFVILTLSGFLFELNNLSRYKQLMDCPGYFNFDPNRNFYSVAREQYPANYPYQSDSGLMAQLAKEWKIGTDVKAICFYPYKIYSSNDYEVFTYHRPSSYPLEWDEVEMELKEGRWFVESEDSVILIKGNKYHVNDSIFIKDESGNLKELPIVGKAKIDGLLYSDSGLYVSVPGHSKNVFLLNPLSEYNIPSDEFGVETKFALKILNPLVKNKIEEYGELIPLTKYGKPMLSEKEAVGWMFYIAQFHLWVVFFFGVTMVLLVFNLYFIHKFPFGKRRYLSFIFGYVIFLLLYVYFYGGFTKFTFLGSMIVVPIVLLIDKKMKNFFVHGRSYIVDGWDETDVEI